MSTAIVAWRKLSRRSTLLAKALNVELFFFKDRLPYLRAIWQTHFAIHKANPSVIIVQLPQGPLLLQALVLRGLMGCKVIADVHTGFLLNKGWKEHLLNGPFKDLLGHADLILAHNETQLSLIPEKLLPKTLVVYDQWEFIIPQPILKASKGDYLVFPASFAPDEPLKEVINAVESLDVPIKLYVTGNWKRQAQIKARVSERVVFTGFLSEDEFNRLIAGSKAVITGSKREYTSLMSAWEAVAYNKPLALTHTETLHSLFGDYAVFFNWEVSESIRKALRTVCTTTPSSTAREKLEQKTYQSLQAFKTKIEILTRSAPSENTS